MILDVFRARCQELREYLEAQRPQSLTAFSLGRNQMIVKLADFFGFELWIVASNHRYVLA